MGLPFEIEEIDILEKLTHLTPEYARINPNMAVPSMDYDGEIVTDSEIILYYLCDKFPGKLIPTDEQLEKDVYKFVSDFYGRLEAFPRFTFGNMAANSEVYKKYFA